MRILIVSSVLGLVLLLGVSVNSCASGCGSHYSDGSRTGYVVKFSRKGLFWKSWEGELALAQAQGPNTVAIATSSWKFSVRDSRVVHQIQDAERAGLRVSLVYQQWVLHPWDISSDYEVTNVEFTAPTHFEEK